MSVEAIASPAAAAALLQHPLRLRLLASAAEPGSATEIAARLRLTRQTVNYHLKELARVRLVRKAGTRKRRNMIEQRYVATAPSYVLSPEILGPLAAGPAHVADHASAAYLLAATSRLQQDVIQTASAGAARLATLTIHSEVCFASAEQRRAFTEHVHAAFMEAVRRHTAPKGRPHRLVLGCAPIPAAKEDSPQ